MRIRRVIVTWAGATMLTAVSCARRSAHVPLPDVLIPVGCASEIMLLRCDSEVSPPKCKSARVKYRSGCEQIVVRK